MPKATRWLAPLLFCLVFGGFAAGLWANYRAIFPGTGLYRVTGVFQSRATDTLMLVKHEAVPGLMAEMSAMVLLAESKDLLDRAGLRPGDRVRLTISQPSEPLLVVEIKKLR